MRLLLHRKTIRTMASHNTSCCSEQAHTSSEPETFLAESESTQTQAHGEQYNATPRKRHGRRRTRRMLENKQQYEDSMEDEIEHQTRMRSVSCNSDDRTYTQWYIPDPTFVETNDGTFAVYIDRGMHHDDSSSGGTAFDTSSAWPTLVLLHGAGSSFRTFTVLCNWLRKQRLTIVGIDLRGHGNTVVQDETDLSLSTLHNDVVRVLEELKHQKLVDFSGNVVLVGHSLGGCVANYIAARQQNTENKHDSEIIRRFDDSLLPLSIPIAAVVALDVVEAAALESFEKTKELLRKRPTRFDSTDEAIEWHLQKGILQLPASAQLSVPSLFSKEEDNGTAVTWRTDLLHTVEHWEGRDLCHFLALILKYSLYVHVYIIQTQDGSKNFHRFS